MPEPVHVLPRLTAIILQMGYYNSLSEDNVKLKSVWDGYGEGLVVRMVRMDGLTVSIIIQTLVTNLRKT